MDPSPALQIGVDVGGTFTDLVSWDGASLRVVKLPSTPPDFERAVIDAVQRAAAEPSPTPSSLSIIHGSTVATNALLQRAGEPVAFVTTDGFRDMLLIGRQNRPELYALDIRRPAPITPEENWFTVRERIDARGRVLIPLEQSDIAQLIARLRGRNLRHAAVCLLFSFVNPVHEQQLAHALSREGFTVSISSDILPEFREYERASTTAINASLRPTVEHYLANLESGLQSKVQNQKPKIAILHSSGGTLPPIEASRSAARLVLSGPAGGVIGAAFVARQAGFPNVITYDMGGTSTDVALVLDGEPQWTTGASIDGLPLALSMFDIHTVGAGGGSIAYLDDGGALHVGPRSAGALPGPASYGRGGTLPTVTDANLILGRIAPAHFLGGAMPLHADLARKSLEPLAARMNKSVIDTALGILRVAEANMAGAVRAVTTRRGNDPRDFSLLSFGGAGGLHACALADSLEIPRVIVPPYAGVLSALGMIVAPPLVDASKTVVHLGELLDDDRLAAEFGHVSAQTLAYLSPAQTARTEVYVDARFKGQSHELKVRIHRPSLAHIREEFIHAYAAQYGQAPAHRVVEIVTLRVRRIGHAADVRLPAITAPVESATDETIELTLTSETRGSAPVLRREALLARQGITGPALLVDPEATTFVPPDWQAECMENGTVLLTRRA